MGSKYKDALLSSHEFIEAGYLQEANRQFFHPLGIALAVNATDGAILVIDIRSDMEGIIFDSGEIEPAKVQRVQRELDARLPIRRRALGYVIQPT